MEVIIVVDDDATSVKVLRMALELRGHHVIETYTPEDAVARCLDKNQKIDMLIADVKMPGTSGTEVAIRIREACTDMPVLFISGTPLEGWQRDDLRNARALLAEPVDFLQKPFAVDALFAKVDNLLRAHGPVPEFVALLGEAERFRQLRSDPNA